MTREVGAESGDFFTEDQLVRHINDHGASDYPSRLPTALPSLLAGANFLGKLIALPRIFSLALSLVLFLRVFPSLLRKGRRREEEGRVAKGETMTWSWLTNGNSFPPPPRSRLIIFSETRTPLIGVFLSTVPSPPARPAQERQKPSRREFRAAVIQFGKFLSRLEVSCERISVCRTSPLENSLNAWQRSGLSDTIEIYGYETRGEGRRGMRKRNCGGVVALM